MAVDIAIEFMTRFASVFGNNDMLVLAVSVFFVFGILYVLNFPRQFSIPMSLIAGLVFIIPDIGGVAGVITQQGLLFFLVIGIGIGFLMFAIFK